jgi:hypothetical protein
MGGVAGPHPPFILLLLVFVLVTGGVLGAPPHPPFITFLFVLFFALFTLVAFFAPFALVAFFAPFTLFTPFLRVFDFELRLRFLVLPKREKKLEIDFI